MELVEFEDIRKGFKPAIPDEDQDYIYELLEEANVELENVVGDLARWIAENPKREARARVVLKRMVRRVLRNPDGYVGESDGNYSYTRAARDGMLGDVELTRKDRRTLGLSTAIKPGSIRVGLPMDSPRNAISRDGRHW